MFRLFCKINQIAKTSYSVRMKHSGTIYFFHGTGDTGSGIRDWIQSEFGNTDLNLSHMKVIYPSARNRPYKAWNGQSTTVWFDREALDPNVSDDKPSVDEACRNMVQEIKSNISHSLNKLILGGFSMGGEMALQLGLRFLPEVAGIFALSSFLGDNSLVYSDLKTKHIPVFMCHGDRDEIVQFSWGENTYNKLSSLGVNVEFHVLNGAEHELTNNELNKLRNWIENITPS